MKIYFAGSIRGGREDAQLYSELIKYLKKYGQVLNEHVGDIKLSIAGEDGSNDEYIYKRDMGYMEKADILIAEVTSPSLGVGYEIGKAEEWNKKILCLHRPQSGKRLSAMIAGNKNLLVKKYKNISGAKKEIDKFFLK